MYGRKEADIKGKTIALEEGLKIRVLAQYRMVGNFLNTFLQCKTALAYELIIEATKWILLRNRRDYNAWIIRGESFI